MALPWPGARAALLVCQGVEKELWGGEPNTTNNRMELMAAIRGLEFGQALFYVACVLSNSFQCSTDIIADL